MGVACQILIQRSREGVHTPGSSVIGTVKYAIDEPTEYKDIVLSLIGKAHCSWTEQQHHGGRKSGSRTVHYQGTEVIVANYVSILNKQKTLPAGSYEHSFSFVLPNDIPPSFKDSTSSIKYQIRLKFEKPSFFSIKKCFTSTLTVYGYVKPTATEGYTTFGLEKKLLRPFSKRSQIIKVKAGSSNVIFAPGENADISYTVTNISDVKVTSIKSELICYTTYTSNYGRKRGLTKVIKESTVETPSVPPDSVANMSSIMPIQAHLYTIQNCKVIQKDYRVKLTLRLPMPYINASVELPIVIGEKCENREPVNRYVMPGTSAEEVEVMGNLPSYWQAMDEDLEFKEHIDG